VNREFGICIPEPTGPHWAAVNGIGLFLIGELVATNRMSLVNFLPDSTDDGFLAFTARLVARAWLILVRCRWLHWIQVASIPMMLWVSSESASSRRRLRAFLTPWNGLGGRPVSVGLNVIHRNFSFQGNGGALVMNGIGRLALNLSEKCKNR
jgi:hypothetical protein